MAIFPTIEVTEIEEVELPLAKEWAWDFETNDFALKNSKQYLVEGEEAVKIWAFKALMTVRFRHSVYSWWYGSELESLIGSGYSRAVTESEAKRMVEECLMPNPYIEGITNFGVAFDKEKLNISFTLITIYGEVEVSGLAY